MEVLEIDSSRVTPVDPEYRLKTLAGLLNLHFFPIHPLTPL